MFGLNSESLRQFNWYYQLYVYSLGIYSLVAWNFLLNSEHYIARRLFAAEHLDAQFVANNKNWNQLPGLVLQLVICAYCLAAKIGGDNSSSPTTTTTNKNNYKRPTSIMSIEQLDEILPQQSSVKKINASMTRINNHIRNVNYYFYVFYTTIGVNLASIFSIALVVCFFDAKSFSSSTTIIYIVYYATIVLFTVCVFSSYVFQTCVFKLMAVVYNFDNYFESSRSFVFGIVTCGVFSSLAVVLLRRTVVGFIFFAAFNIIFGVCQLVYVVKYLRKFVHALIFASVTSTFENGDDTKQQPIKMQPILEAVHDREKYTIIDERCDRRLLPPPPLSRTPSEQDRLDSLFETELDGRKAPPPSPLTTTFVGSDGGEILPSSTPMPPPPAQFIDASHVAAPVSPHRRIQTKKCTVRVSPSQKARIVLEYVLVLVNIVVLFGSTCYFFPVIYISRSDENTNLDWNVFLNFNFFALVGYAAHRWIVEPLWLIDKPRNVYYYFCVSVCRAALFVLLWHTTIPDVFHVAALALTYGMLYSETLALAQTNQIAIPELNCFVIMVTIFIAMY